MSTDSDRSFGMQAGLSLVGASAVSKHLTVALKNTIGDQLLERRILFHFRSRPVAGADGIKDDVQITINIAAQRTVEDIKHPAERWMNIFFDAGHVDTVVDFTGRTWDYTVTGSQLTQVTAPTSEIVQYSYHTGASQQDLLKEIIDPNGETTTFSYYANRRGFEVTDAEGHTASLSYNLFRNRTAFTDERGFTTYYDFNDEGNVEQERYPDRTTVEYAWADGLKQSVTDEFGQTELYEYFGNLYVS